ncbi:MAG TPA: oligosaccharide flippase family protein [Anaerolineales bacterium]|nr:oligosaccharide flippase family protein [Anaerolineales bacterium]
MSQNSQHIARGALFTALAQYLQFGLGFLGGMILYRLIAPEYWTVLAIATPWTSYLNFFRFDFSPAVISGSDDHAFLSTHFWLENATAALAFPLAGLAWLLLPASIKPAPQVWIFIFILLTLYQFQAFASTSRYLTEKRLQYQTLSGFTFVQSVLGFAIPITFAWLGWYLPAVLATTLIPGIIPAIGVLWHTRFLPQWKFDRDSARVLLRSGYLMWTNGLLGKVVYEFDDWLVGNVKKSRQPEWLGAGGTVPAFYSRAYNAGKMPMDVFAGFIGSIALSLYASALREGKERFLAVYRQLTWLLVYLIAFSSGVALLATEEVVLILMGPKWPPVVPLFRLMSGFILTRPLYQNIIQALWVLKKEKAARNTTALQAVILVLAGIPAVWFWGAAGVSVVVSVMALAGWLLAEWYLQHATGEPLWQVYLLPSVAMCIGLAFGLWLVGLLPPSLPFWAIMAVKVLAMAIPFGAILALWERNTLLAAIRLIRK